MADQPLFSFFARAKRRWAEAGGLPKVLVDLTHPTLLSPAHEGTWQLTAQVSHLVKTQDPSCCSLRPGFSSAVTEEPLCAATTTRLLQGSAPTVL